MYLISNYFVVVLCYMNKLFIRCRRVKIRLHIMDGITAMEGEGPTAGSTYLAKKILISTDPLALDTTAIKMLGLDIKDIPILQAAIERKLGESNKDKIQICVDSCPVEAIDKVTKKTNQVFSMIFQ